VDFSAYLNMSAVWLNEHALAVVATMAVIALITEAMNGSGLRSASRATTARWLQTWLTNAGLLVCALSVASLLAPWLASSFGVVLSGESGLLAWLKEAGIPYTSQVLLGMLLLDLLNYGLHRVFHRIPLLWRLHQVHHSDTAVNASTHFRQHPVQVVVLPLMQLPMLWLLGISGVSWVLYATLSTVAQLWQHAEPGKLAHANRWLGFVLITRSAHRTHHDQRHVFHDRNYGTLFSVWDRLLGTYSAAPAEFQLGLRKLPSAKGTTQSVSFMDCLRMPFQSTTSRSADGARTQFHTPFQGKK